MAELVLSARTFPEPISRLLRTEKVKVRESYGEVHLIPIEETPKPTNHCSFLGLFANGGVTVDGFLERTRADKELER